MNSENVKSNLIVKLTFDFSSAVMLFCDKLYETQKFIIANQLLRAALSIGANVREAQNAESIADFVHKMKIACKEAEEAEFYLQLIEKAYSYDGSLLLLQNLASIHRVLNKIVSTSKRKVKTEIN